MIITLCPLSEKRKKKKKKKKKSEKKKETNNRFGRVIQNGVAAVIFSLHDNYVVSTQWQKQKQNPPPTIAFKELSKMA